MRVIVFSFAHDSFMCTYEQQFRQSMLHVPSRKKRKTEVGSYMIMIIHISTIYSFYSVSSV